MDDGKPSGPKAKWWSRPPAGRNRPAERADAEPVAQESAAVHDMAAEPRAAAEAADEVLAPLPAEEIPAPLRAEEPLAFPDRPGESLPPASHSAAQSSLPAHPAGGPLVPAPSAGEPPVPGSGRQPRHAPDEYSTPPYGGPGPWAPAPPVQRPVPTPAHGTPVPPSYPGANGHPPTAPPPAPETAVPAPGEAYAAQIPGEAYAAHIPGEAFAAPGSTPSAQPHPLQQHLPRPSGYQQPQGQPQAPSQWVRYDPWGAPQQPLRHSGPPPGTAIRPRRSRRGSALAGAVLLALVAGGIGGGIGSYVERNGGLTTVELPQADRDNGDRAPDSVAGIASSALPSVVTLHVSGSAESGTGTGFVLDDKGHILTNNHVVAPAGSSGDITVTFSGGETAPAEVVGKDSGYDLAVVKVRGVSGLKPLPLGNSDNVQVGDPVVAIGAPFDLSNTVTSGIISAKQRPITAGGEKGDGTDVSYVDALQTDAPINPGNSGGPLVDADARVIGINSAIRAADSGSGPDGGQSGSIGLGFAIPINQGKRVAEELINTGKATHPVIGVTLDMEYTGDGAKVGGKGAEGGAAVTEGGAADDAGIRAGDVITEVEGRRVHSGEELIVKIRAHRPGDRLALRLTRDGEELSMTLTLGSASGT
ncbi:trypsin-like peptidase domain-containing protein [Streptomyces sp. B1I3]|uniref:trypsin-like peptidase domain-containing protein n=1 Tax=Streptomyces sp. B1I3 TaxID=3042264 RepID=UPI0027842EE3|nr:trypsin-like peptidase domain-containing protein [Streptomyces sp. B1I3]MDQ0794150.1 putative serine protease PepD [Streptomyces sp. B1I3]